MSIEIINDIDNIHTHMITNETEAFYLRYKGTGGKDEDIFDNDVLVLGKNLSLQNDQLIIAAWAGKPELKLKRSVFRGAS